MHELQGVDILRVLLDLDVYLLLLPFLSTATQYLSVHYTSDCLFEALYRRDLRELDGAAIFGLD